MTNYSFKNLYVSNHSLILTMCHLLLNVCSVCDTTISWKIVVCPFVVPGSIHTKEKPTDVAWSKRESTLALDLAMEQRIVFNLHPACDQIRRKELERAEIEMDYGEEN